MSIVRKVKLVERLFGRLDQEIAGFRAETGLFCVAGCGHCCTKPDIDASPLEFLPYALYLFMNGKAHDTLVQLKKENSGICMIYSPLSLEEKSKGSCSEYPYRGLICRLFGFGASRDKFGQLRLATCKIIKEGQAGNYKSTVEAINEGQYVPIFSDYYQNLAQIDFRLGNMLVPINDAIKIAIEEVLHHYAYRPLQGKFKGAA
ncbi:MAG: Fe-S-cluster containining protein [Cyclobacteriaceae bacterium]|jgi:Fe-S-cluster containining protein